MPTVLLADFLRHDLVFRDFPATDPPTLRAELARRAADAVDGLDADDVRQRLEQREAEGSTAVGCGMALPHALMPGLSQTVLAVAHLAGGGLALGAADGQPVDIVVMLLSPARDPGGHLRTLARIARIVAQPALLDQLRGADGPDTMYRLLVEEDARHVY